MYRINGIFQKAIKQTRPFRSLRAEAGVGLLLAADVFRRSWGIVTAQSGVTSQQHNVLRILRGAGGKGLPTREIAARLIEKSPGITRFIDQLESRRLIKRRRSRKDRRQVFCTITRSGLKLLSKTDRPINQWEEQSLSMLNEMELKQMIKFLENFYSFHDV